MGPLSVSERHSSIDSDLGNGESFASRLTELHTAVEMTPRGPYRGEAGVYAAALLARERFLVVRIPAILALVEAIENSQLWIADVCDNGIDPDADDWPEWQAVIAALETLNA